MSEFKSRYTAKQSDSEGFVQYSDTDNSVWHDLYQRQIKIIPNRACDDFFKGIELLQLNPNNIPQLPNVNKHMQATTGWSVEPVTALISHEKFFKLLANRQFPAATFIRARDEFDYVKEPDIFHELFGHCPMLMNPVFADFIAQYATKVLQHDKSEWPLLQRLFWFTVEFGLLQTNEGIRAYGGGVLSSVKETPFSIESDEPIRKPFNIVDVLRTPYRIDRMQPIYYVIEDFDQLYALIRNGIDEQLAEARQLGEFEPLFEVDPDNPSVHINAC